MRALKLILCATILTTLAVPPLAAAPFDQQTVPAGAKWFIHFDIEGLAASHIGGLIVQELTKGTSGAGIDALANLTGVNITKDLRSITMYGMSHADNAGMVVVRGKLDHGKLITLVKTNETYKEIKYGNFVVHQWTDNPKAAKPGPTQYAAFPKDDTLAITQDLKQLLSLLDGKRDASAKAPAVSYSKGAYLVAYATDLAAQAKDKPEAALMSKIASVILENGEDNGKIFLRLAITAANDQVAGDLREVGVGLLALGKLLPLPDEAAAMLKGATVTSDNRTAQIKLNPSVDEVVSLLQWMDKQKAKEEEKKKSAAK
jgi:hypothetical protein